MFITRCGILWVRVFFVFVILAVNLPDSIELRLFGVEANKSEKKASVKQKNPPPNKTSEKGTAVKASKSKTNPGEPTVVPVKEKGTTNPPAHPAMKDLSLPKTEVKNQLDAATSAKVQKLTQNLQTCRQDAVNEAKKSPKVSEQAFKYRLTVCREHFPLANLYLECKKKAFAISGQDEKGTAAVNKVALIEALKSCDSFFANSDFNNKGSNPFFTYNSKLYFAGVGMNAIQSVKDLPPPNFDCQPVFDVLSHGADPKFVLFGSHPSQFAHQENNEQKNFLLALNRPGILGKSARLDGKLTGDFYATTAANLYFPSAPCVYINLGAKSDERTYRALNLYYLLNREYKQVMPFAAIAFYQSDKLPQTTRLVSVMSKLLGEGYVMTKNPGSPNFIYFSRSKLVDFDRDGDPRNLCTEPRIQEFLVGLKISSEKKDSIDYILVANIKNYCAYGDALAQSILRKVRVPSKK